MKRLKTIDIKNEVPDEDGERELTALWRDSPDWEAWSSHLDALIRRLEEGERGVVSPHEQQAE